MLPSVILRQLQHVVMLYLSRALRLFPPSWILLIEGQLFYRLRCPAERQSSAMIGWRDRLLINLTLAPIYQQVLLYYGYGWSQEYESAMLDAEQNRDSNCRVARNYALKIMSTVEAFDIKSLRQSWIESGCYQASYIGLESFVSFFAIRSEVYQPAYLFGCAKKHRFFTTLSLYSWSECESQIGRHVWSTVPYASRHNHHSHSTFS